MYKIINFIIKTVIFLFVLLYLLVYAGYRYLLKDVDLSVYSIKQISYNSDYYSALWVSPKIRPYSRKRPKVIEMKPIYPIHDVAQYFINNNSFMSPSYKVSYWVVNNLSNLRHQRFKKYAIQVWISHHLTFEETANLYFKTAYYGQSYHGLKEATKGYFHKKPNKLNSYEIIMLIALTNAPSYLDPKRHPKRLLLEMNYIIDKLKHNFPLYYEKLTNQTKLPQNF